MPARCLQLYRGLIALRRELGEGFGLLEPSPSVLAYRRGRSTVALNFSERPAPSRSAGSSWPCAPTWPGAVRSSPVELAPLAGVVLRDF